MRNHWIDKKTEKKIDRIIENFDFAIVRKAIKLLDLPYRIADLEEHARYLLRKVAYEDDWGWFGVDIGCGLTAEKLPNNELVLHFAIELNQSGV